MKNSSSSKHTAIETLDVVASVATIPPAPASGVFPIGTLAARTHPAPTTALPCAMFWPGGAAAETLRPSQVLSVALDELDWLYEHTDDESDPASVQARAAIESWLAELSEQHQAAIAAQHCPVAWPDDHPGHEEDSFALVLHVLWPSTADDLRRYVPEQLELRARRKFEITLERKGPGAVRALIREARWLYEEAARAYADVRGRAPSVIPAGSTAFASSFDGDA